MKHRKFIKKNSAVAGVVEAILLIALVSIILSTIQLYYIPVIMEQKESDHMDRVSNQFSQLKSVIEIQSMMGATESSEAIVYTPMSSPITLGSKELPYFVSARSIGQIDIIDQEDVGDQNISLSEVYYKPLTSIKYRATNFYFPKDLAQPWQEYVLEGGGVILKQSDGEVMKIYPAITVENHSELNYIKIKYFVPVFTGFPGKKTYSDWEDCYIYTNYISHDTYSEYVTKISINSDYPSAWYNCLVNESRGILWEYYNNEYLDINRDNNVITIKPGIIGNLFLDLTVAEIGVQVGPGYIT
jgi:hypothetical protein